MKRSCRAACILSALLLAKSLAAQVSLEVVDLSRHVYSYEPVMVIIEARNTGSVGLAIPGSGCAAGGATLEIGPAGGLLRDSHLIPRCSPTEVIWLAPGDRWLFFQHAVPGVKGEFEVQAVLRSYGTCGGQPIGPEKDRISHIENLPDYVPDQYFCWEGEARSERVPLEVEVPSADVDLEAARLLELDQERWSNNWRISLIERINDLFGRYPTSHYTYAASSSSSEWAGMLTVVILQPDNELNPWVVGAMKATLAYRERPCATPYKSPLPEPPDQAERYQRVFAAYPPPKAFQDYLRQQELVYSNEECPKPLGANQTDDAQPPK